MLGIVKLQVHLGNTQVALKFIVCKTLAASATIEVVYDQLVKEIRREQKLVVLDSGDCILIEQMSRGRMKSQPPLSYSLTYPKENPQPTPIARVDKKTFLSAHSQHKYWYNRIELAQLIYNRTPYSTRKHYL